ncbi:MAG: 16S rRNA processing protein RimM [Bacteroidia bacterium]|nr:16S rRNA processing protein RimM [Bacteroidia bacterium]
MDIRSCYKVGYIAKTHGLNGGVTAIFSEAGEFESQESVFVEVNHNLIPYFVESFSDRGEKGFIKFEDINTIDQAEMLKGCSLYLPKTVRPKLKRGDFYNDEVIGFEVEDFLHGILGAVTEIIESGPNRLLSVDRSGKEVLIPVNGPFIKSVNKSKKKIHTELPEGFLDL